MTMGNLAMELLLKMVFPVPATGLGTGDVLAVSVSAGHYHTCATLENGTARCWGKDSSRQIGTITGLATPSPGRPDVETPTKVYQNFASPSIELTNVDSINPGDDHTCSLRNEQVWCWGDALRGQLGIGGNPPLSGNARYTAESSSSKTIAAPVLYDNGSGNVALDNIKAVSSGQGHSCAVRGDDDEVWCWGYNDGSDSSRYRLGLGDRMNRPIATQLTFVLNS